jgi:hypothetical protein
MDPELLRNSIKRHAIIRSSRDITADLLCVHNNTESRFLSARIPETAMSRAAQSKPMPAATGNGSAGDAQNGESHLHNQLSRCVSLTQLQSPVPYAKAPVI